MMRAVFMGTPDFAVDSLRALAREHEVIAVVTQPDKPKGRGGKLLPPPVKEEALAASIPVCQPKKVRDAAFIEYLSGLKPDVIVVAAFGQIIPQAVLDLPKYGCVNVHASLLPKYRGAAPIQWAVINGEKISGVTTMRMNAGLDTGDILLTKEVELAPDETGGSLFDRLKEAGARLLLETLEALEAGTVTPRPQPEESPTAYAAMLTKQMGRIDWTKSAAELERLVRGLSPWPGTYTRLGDKTLKIWRAENRGAADCGGAADQDGAVNRGGAAKCGGSADQGGEADCGGAADQSGAADCAEAAPGTVVFADKRGLAVQTGDGLLILREVQLEGKKRMETDAFLRGYPVHAGEKLD